MRAFGNRGAQVNVAKLLEIANKHRGGESRKGKLILVTGVNPTAAGEGKVRHFRNRWFRSNSECKFQFRFHSIPSIPD